MRPKDRLHTLAIAACAVLGLVLTVHNPVEGDALDLALFAARWTGNTVLVGCLAGPLLFGRSMNLARRPVPRRSGRGGGPLHRL